MQLNGVHYSNGFSARTRRRRCAHSDEGVLRSSSAPQGTRFSFESFAISQGANVSLVPIRDTSGGTGFPASRRHQSRAEESPHF